jgi:uncharacterized membrane protein
MIQYKNEFLHLLEIHLGKHPEKEQILTEYECHITEMIAELSDCNLSEQDIRREMLNRLGSPEEIAASWREELSATPKKTQWLFILSNLVFFAGGSVLTLLHNAFDLAWVEILWSGMTSIPFIIILLYLVFWAMLGYEIGKGFGHKGRSLMKRTFIISIVPNMLMMYLTLFKIIPHDWFQPLLSPSFIVTCILFTALLYPICLAGYRWGRKASV